MERAACLLWQTLNKWQLFPWMPGATFGHKKWFCGGVLILDLTPKRVCNCQIQQMLCRLEIYRNITAYRHCLNPQISNCNKTCGTCKGIKPCQNTCFTYIPSFSTFPPSLYLVAIITAVYVHSSTIANIYNSIDSEVDKKNGRIWKISPIMPHNLYHCI